MRRREFLAALGGAAVAWPAPGHGQGVARIRRIGVFLGSAVESDPDTQVPVKLLRDNLQARGWNDGVNVRFDYRFSAGDPALMDKHVGELIALAPDLIVVRGNRPVTLLKQATRTIPIVFAQVGDPVGSGIVENLSHPGGNVTGFTHFEPSMGGKWLEALREVAPALKRAAILMHPTTPANIAFLKAAEAAAPALGLTVAAAGVRNASDIEAAIPTAAVDGGGLVVLPHDITSANERLIVALATRHRVPAVYAYRNFVKQGGLLSYSFDMSEHWRQVAIYVDRILRGEKPTDLPVQAPTKFELVINLVTAKTLALNVSAGLLARADEVIE
jgi:putative tryptophan/tyrosine transport system substrate-binding protein